VIATQSPGPNMLRLVVAFVLGTARVVYGDGSIPLTCVEVPSELAEPVYVRGEGTLKVVWGGKPVGENTVTATVCSASATPTPSYSLTGDGGTVLELGPNVATLKLAAPWNRLPVLREAARFEVPPLAQVHQRLAACVDGLDNDGDGLRDEVSASQQHHLLSLPSPVPFHAWPMYFCAVEVAWISCAIRVSPQASPMHQFVIPHMIFFFMVQQNKNDVTRVPQSSLQSPTRSILVTYGQWPSSFYHSYTHH
jgi:hypothetical protein